MTLPNTPYAPQTAPQMAFLDQTFAATAALGVVPCTASGTNLITLTPNANTPTISAYANYAQFSFVVAHTTTGAVTLQVGALPALPAYAADGTTQLGSAAFQINTLYVVAFNQALNSGSGGFTVVSASATGVVAGVYNQPTLTIDASGRVTAASAGVAAFNYLGGMSLSWTSAAPSTTLTVLRGACSDFANATTITLTSGISKSTAGAWTAGTGNNGLGTGLTYSSSTWYHVFPIINNGVSDVYFDTSVTAANQPANTTAFRRVGSFLTNGASTAGQISITPFVQDGDLFQWKNGPVPDVSGGTLSTANRTNVPVTLPLGVIVNGVFGVEMAGINANARVILTDIATADVIVSNAAFSVTAPAGTSTIGGAMVMCRTNALSQIATRGDTAATYFLNTHAWYDTRGRNS